MPPKRRRRRGRPPAEQPRRSFLQRRSTKWLAAAIITMTVAIVLGIVANQTGDEDDEPNAVPTATELIQP